MHAFESVPLTPATKDCDGFVMLAVRKAGAAGLGTDLLAAGDLETCEEHYAHAQRALAHPCS